jgi:zinc/manganese transport system substrate-binding protein
MPQRPLGTNIIGRRALVGAGVLASLPWRARCVLAHGRGETVATFSILQDLTATIAGEGMSVRALVGANADAHSYQSRLSDGQVVEQAALLVSNGLGFEEWLPRLLSAVHFSGRHVVASAGIAPLMRAPRPGAEATVADPHCWHDVANARRYVVNIAAGLEAVAPANAAAHRARAAAFDGRLAALDGWIRDQIARVPSDKRKVIISHDAFGYFARAYGVEFLAVRGINPERDPAARDIADLITLARRERIKALFVENLGNSVFVSQIARDLDGYVGEKLFADSLSSPDGPVPTYEALMRHNVSALVAGMLRN